MDVLVVLPDQQASDEGDYVEILVRHLGKERGGNLTEWFVEEVTQSIAASDRDFYERKPGQVVNLKFRSNPTNSRPAITLNEMLQI